MCPPGNTPFVALLHRAAHGVRSHARSRVPLTQPDSHGLSHAPSSEYSLNCAQLRTTSVSRYRGSPNFSHGEATCLDSRAATGVVSHCRQLSESWYDTANSITGNCMFTSPPLGSADYGNFETPSSGRGRRRSKSACARAHAHRRRPASCASP